VCAAAKCYTQVLESLLLASFVGSRDGEMPLPDSALRPLRVRVDPQEQFQSAGSDESIDWNEVNRCDHEHEAGDDALDQLGREPERAFVSTISCRVGKRAERAFVSAMLLPMSIQFLLCAMVMTLLSSRLTVPWFMRWAGFEETPGDTRLGIELDLMRLALKHFRMPKETVRAVVPLATDGELRSLPTPVRFLESTPAKLAAANGRSNP
jgi:hypothetical protein